MILRMTLFDSKQELISLKVQYSSKINHPSNKEAILKLVAHYLINEKNHKQLPINDVTRFHLGNGASIEDININANVSEVGFNRSFGVMVNYLYEMKNIEKNHEDYVNNKKVIISDKLKKFI